MPVRPEESLEKMIASLKDKTGKTLAEWHDAIVATGFSKHGEKMAFLKGEHGLTHGFANIIALRHDASAAQGGDPIEEMFAKRQDVRPIYDSVLAKILEFGGDVDLAPKKGYVSVRRSKQFAVLQPASARLDVGINLKDVAPVGKLEASGSFNTMLSHRVRVGSVAEVDADLIGWLRKAYDGA